MTDLEDNHMQAFEVNHQYYTGTGAHILVTKRTAKTATVTQYGVTKRCKIEQWPCGEVIRWNGQMVYASHTDEAHTRLLEKQAAEEREAAAYRWEGERRDTELYTTMLQNGMSAAEAESKLNAMRQGVRIA